MIEWNYIVIALSLLLLFFLTWKEIYRPNKARLMWRLIASIFAIIGLACLALPITYIKTVKFSSANDVILLTGSEPILAQELIAQLNPGGRLIAFVGEAPAMAARRITVIEPGVQTSQDLFETNVRALSNAPQAPQFVF